MGGEKATVIQAPAQGPAPSASQSAADLYQAQLKYGQPMAQQEFDIQSKFMPQQAALYQALYNQYSPEMARTQQQTQQELYPYQSQIVEQGAMDALSRLQNPNYMTEQEQLAQDTTRQKAIDALQRSMRERANLGGNLYGGRAAASEAQSVSDLVNQYQLQDYAQRMSAGQAAQQALTPYMQILYPQVGTQQPSIQPFQYTSAVPSADSLYNAMAQARQPQYFTTPGQPGLWAQIFGK